MVKKFMVVNEIVEMESELSLNSDLEKEVWDMIKKQDPDEIISNIKDILHYGLSSGIISEMVWYKDTCAFYEKHQKEISSILVENLKNYGKNASPQDLFGKNWDSEDPLAFEEFNQNLLAWFGFEETTRKFADQLGIDI